ncbi:hypothetical protein ACUR5C_15240 [Aliikangiella sp. IMCC44653]
MFELIIGIIVGATFAEFWRHLYRLIKRKAQAWQKGTSEGSINDKVN